MRLTVARSGQAQALGCAAGAAFALSLACGSSGGSGLFGGTAGRPSAGASGIAGASGVGGLSNTGGNASSSGGIAVSGGSSTTAGAPAVAGNHGNGTGGNGTGGNGTGGSATGGSGAGGNSTGGALPGGTTAGGASSGGEANGGNAGTSAAAGTSVGGSTASGGTAGAGGSGGGDCAESAERCDGIDNDCNASVDDNACPAKCTGFELNGQGYMVCNANVDASKAASVCEAQGLRLAWIESIEENASLLQTLGELNQSSGRGGAILEVHIGASDSAKEGRWKWVGGPDFWQGGAKGEPVDGAYANWGQGRPNGAIGDLLGSEDCAVFVIDQANDGEPGEWADVDCENAYGVLCEQP